MTESKVIGKTTKKQEHRHSSSIKNQEQRKASSSLHSRPITRKQSRKGEKPKRLEIASGKSSGFQCSNWICKNPVCRAVLSSVDTFCKRCSCCICHLYDENKDPSLWLECRSESGEKDSCGLSCHIECALQHKKVGVVDLDQLMQLDGSYCCASCGKVSGILGCWKKQLTMAKEARRLDVLCYRVQLSYRLLKGTSRFEELHLMIKDAKSRLEEEVGPLTGVSTKMARGIVSRISVAVEVQKLCALAIAKADEWLATITGSNLGCKDSLPAACRFLFEEISSSSVIIVLLEPSNASSNDIKGYKLWYCMSREETLTKEPVSVFPGAQRRILISSLQPCTEYTFRIVSYTDAGDLGHSEAKCFTKSIEIIRKNTKSAAPTKQKEKNVNEGCSSSEHRDPETALADGSSGLKVNPAQSHSQELGNLEENNSANTEECRNVRELIKSNSPDQSVSALDLNVGNPEGNSCTNVNECCNVKEVIKSNSPDHSPSALDLNVGNHEENNSTNTEECSNVREVIKSISPHQSVSALDLNVSNHEGKNSSDTEECCNVREVIKSNSPCRSAFAFDLNVGHPEGNNCTNTEECCNVREVIRSNSPDHLASTSHRLDLNVASVPDLNEEVTQSSLDVDNGCTMERAIEVDDDAASHGIVKSVIAKSHGCDDFQTWTHRKISEVPAFNSRAESSKKRAASITDDPQDCNSTLINRSPFKATVGKFDESFEYCVKIIRWLECEGYIDKEFRLKLLTWYSIRSTEQERRVVNTFIETLIDEPVSLAGQLVDSFSEVISSKRQRDGFGGKL